MTKNQTSPALRSGTFKGSKGVNVIRQPSYLPNTTTVDFFCFREVKSKPADLSLSNSGATANFSGVTRTSSKNESVAAFWRWMDRCEQYV
jgi:hypothetical protein